jgi:plasmid stabilization system protein ParE
VYKSIVLYQAKEDIRKAAEWYNERQIGLGKRFISEVRNKVYYIRQNPKISGVRYNNVRTAILSDFPFMIHYTIDENIKAILIVAVLHTSRDPGLWNR